MNADVESYIRQNYGWSKLPLTIKQVLGNSQKDYDKWVVQFSVKNQLRHRGNIVRHVRKDEKGYYEELLRYSREHLMLYPYHLSDFIVTRMRITPFQYYISIMQDLLEQERSYDSLPNFTAADCLRLLGIGRNQYIDLMNQCRSSKKFFGVRKKPIRDLLPSKPVGSVPIEPWWLVQVGYVTEDDIRLVTKTEKQIIDKIIDNGAQKSGEMVAKDVKSLYSKGLVYLDVPVEDNDCFIVPPLEGFVMNRVLGDYFENLLYQIFVSIDEHTTVAELANVLQTDLQLIKNVVSMYCRLGFAKKKGVDINDEKYHHSWKTSMHNKLERTRSKEMEDFLISLNTDSEGIIVEGGTPLATPNTSEAPVTMSDLLASVTTHSKRIGFLFDSTLTAFLMMGNLSSGLKSHAVTMFEVGKLSDESLDSFLTELEKVGDVGEGEAQRYFHHALTLRSTILFLRHNAQMLTNNDNQSPEESPCIGPSLDLIRCESLQNLETDTCSRLLNKNYSLLVSMAPLTNEIRPVTSCKPPHLGPAIPEVNSVWFKLFIYMLTKMGPPSLLLAKGTRLRVLPRIFKNHERLLITPWGHDPGNVPAANALITLNDALCHSAVLIQGQGTGGEVAYVPFPLDEEGSQDEKGHLRKHPSVESLSSFLDLHHSCGYITLMRLGSPPNPAQFPQEQCAKGTTTHSTPLPCSSPTSPVNGIKDHISKELLASELDKLAQADESPSDQCDSVIKEVLAPVDDLPSANLSSKADENWVLLDCSFGIPLFEADLNKDVCQRVVKFKLCQQHSLKQLMQSSRQMILQLLEFISKHQSALENDKAPKGFSFPNKKGEHEMPLPTRNLLYANGQLNQWDGS